MRVLVTGSEGMLGSKVCEVLSQYNIVFATDIGTNYIYMNITDPFQVEKVVRRYEPEVIVHCAAMTDVNACTTNIEQAFKVNTLGTRYLAVEASRTRIPIIYISTDYVFDGNNTNWTEFSTPCPKNVYGASKLAGEKAVAESTNEFITIRTSWLFSSTHHNFVKTIYNKLKGDIPLEVVTDQQGSPTYAKDLAEFINQLIGTRNYGTYHFSNSGSCSWYLFAKKVQELSGLTKQLVLPITTPKDSQTVRPRNSVLRNFRRELEGFAPSRSWEDALAECVEELKIQEE